MATVGRVVGLRVPDYGIAHVGAFFADLVVDETARTLLKANVGENFASVLVGPSIRSWDPACTSTSGDLRSVMDGVLTFDAAVVNGDRSARNPNLLWDGRDELHLIDHGLACPVHHWSDEELARFRVLPDPLVQAHAGYQFLRGQGCQFSYVLGNWAANMTPRRWEELRALIPNSWEERPGDIDRIFQFLTARSGQFLEVETSLRRVVQ